MDKLFYELHQDLNKSFKYMAKNHSTMAKSGYGTEKSEILRLLIEKRGENLSIRKIALSRKINYKSAYNAVNFLESRGIISLNRYGNTLNCAFNNNFDSLVFSVEDNRRKNLLKNKNLQVIHSRLTMLNFPFIALLFGSYAKQKQNKYSDIDLLIITANTDEIEQEIKLLPLDLHLTAITPQEFIQMAKSREFSVVSEALKKNIILIGIEEYYRLLKNAGRITD